MAFKDLQEHLSETFALNTYEKITEGLAWVRAKRAEKRRERYEFATNGRARLAPGPAKRQTPEGRLEKRRVAQLARREAARGAPKTKEAWRLTPEQKAWIATNGLSLGATARQLGITKNAVKFHRRKALTAGGEAQ